MSQQIYTISDISRISGFTLRQIDYWARQGIVIPSIQQSHGPGTRRLYSFEDLVQLRFIRKLKQHGWSTQKIREAIARLRVVMDNPNPLKSAVLVYDKRTILAICKTKEGQRVVLDTLDPNAQQVMWIFIEALEKEMLDIVQPKKGDIQYGLNYSSEGSSR